MKVQPSADKRENYITNVICDFQYLDFINGAAAFIALELNEIFLCVMKNR